MLQPGTRRDLREREVRRADGRLEVRRLEPERPDVRRLRQVEALQRLGRFARQRHLRQLLQPEEYRHQPVRPHFSR